MSNCELGPTIPVVQNVDKGIRSLHNGEISVIVRIKSVAGEVVGFVTKVEAVYILQFVCQVWPPFVVVEVVYILAKRNPTKRDSAPETVLGFGARRLISHQNRAFLNPARWMSRAR